MSKKIKKYYDEGLWTERRVRDAVSKGVISADQFKEITGKDL